MMTEEIQNRILRAADVIRSAKHVTAFTGAGISVESGIPPFRGDEGIWNKYDPVLFDIRHFMEYPGESWKVIKEVFYDCFGMARPNRAHEVLAGMERLGFLKEVITQNIDNLHHDAGSTVVHEFHGNSRNLMCTKTGELIPVAHADLDAIPPMHPATGGLLKPDFIFFGEGIPPSAFEASVAAAQKADVFLVIGTTGEVMPAGQIPFMAKENGATIIEVNTTESNYTHRITDIFLTGRASEIMDVLMAAL